MKSVWAPIAPIGRYCARRCALTGVIAARASAVVALESDDGATGFSEGCPGATRRPSRWRRSSSERARH